MQQEEQRTLKVAVHLSRISSVVFFTDHAASVRGIVVWTEDCRR